MPGEPITFPTVTQGDTKLIACPNCGSTDDWVSTYPVICRHKIKSIAAENGGYAAPDYSDSYDYGDVAGDEFISCSCSRATLYSLDQML